MSVRATSITLAVVAVLGLGPLALRPSEARPDRPAEPLVARRADGAPHWWGALSPDHATPAMHRAHGCAVAGGSPTAAEEGAFYAARDGEDRRGLRPRVEVRLGAAGELLGYGCGAPGVTGAPPAGGRLEARDPTAAELADLAARERRRSARERAIQLQAQAGAATSLGLVARAAELASEAQAALAEAQR